MCVVCHESANIEKNSAVSEEGHVLTAYVFFLAGMHIKSFLKSLFRNKTPDLSLKYILIQVHDQQGQQQEERKKNPEGKKVLKKRPDRKKNGIK